MSEFTTFESVFQLSFDIERGAELSEIAKEQAKKGELVVAGYATTFDLGLEGAIITRDALRNAPKDLSERPTILYNHDQNRPIGRVLKSFVDDKGLFVIGAIDETEKEIQAKIQSGTLSKFSIRGRILRSHDEWNEQLRQSIKVIDDLKLLEVSVVSVPAVSQAEIREWYLQRGFSLENTNQKGGESDLKKEDIKREEEMKEPKEEKVEEVELAEEDLELEEDLQDLVEDVEGGEAEEVEFDVDSQMELLFDLEEKISDLMVRAEDLAKVNEKLDKILEIVQEILKKVEKYPYPYPYPYPKQQKSSVEEEPKSESAESEALKEIMESIKELKEKVTALEENVVVRGTVPEEKKDDVTKELEEITRSEQFQKASLNEKLRILLNFAKEKGGES